MKMVEFVNGMYLYIAEDIVLYSCSVYEKKSKGVEKKVDGLPQLQSYREKGAYYPPRTLEWSTHSVSD